MTTTIAPPNRLGVTLIDYHERIQRGLDHIRAEAPPSDLFNPGYVLPAPDQRLAEFFAVSGLRVADLGEYGSHPMRLLDLMANPGTRTTKTIASLVMVARAVHHIQRTGEPILIITPTSANKGTALRDAVYRAISTGLVDADSLRILTVVPASSRHKIWTSGLDTVGSPASRNPVAVYHGERAAAVKQVAADFVAAHGQRLAAGGLNVWYSLDINNYRVADAVRAYFEHDAFPPAPGRKRIHAHAVSSAYGLLGHHFGRQLLGNPQPAPGYLLVQHLGTPDMVQHLRTGRFDAADRPVYTHDPGSGLFRQDGDPRFPAACYDPDERLDATFYTHRPVTSPEMDRIIAAQGGDGIVVSLYECLGRYPEIRQRLNSAGVNLPADPRDLREWSLVMVLTGVLNALDRGLLRADEIIVHGSGCYGVDDFTPLASDRLFPVRTADDIAAVVDAAQGVST